MQLLSPRSRQLGSKIYQTGLSRISIEACCRGHLYDSKKDSSRLCQSCDLPKLESEAESLSRRSKNIQEVDTTPTSTVSSSSTKTPQTSNNTMEDVSANTAYFSILSAFEKTVEMDDDYDSQIMLATRENMDWSYPYLLRKDQIQHIDEGSNGVIGEGKIRRPDTPRIEYFAPPQRSSHSCAKQPNEVAMRVIGEQSELIRKPQKDAEPFLEGTVVSGLKSSKPPNRVGTKPPRSKSETLGQPSLRASYLHHNALRRCNSTGNFSRPRYSTK